MDTIINDGVPQTGSIDSEEDTSFAGTTITAGSSVDYPNINGKVYNGKVIGLGIRVDWPGLAGNSDFRVRYQHRTVTDGSSSFDGFQDWFSVTNDNRKIENLEISGSRVRLIIENQDGSEDMNVEYFDITEKH